MHVKSAPEVSLLDNLQETFDTLRLYDGNGPSEEHQRGAKPKW